MNGKPDALEEALKSLTPRQPSSFLRERIARELGDNAEGISERPPRLVTPWHRRGWLQVAATITLLLTGLVTYRSSLQPPPIQIAQTVVIPRADLSARTTYQPVAVKRYLTGYEDAGITLHQASGPARKARYRTLERSEWHDPVNGRHCTIWKPREQTVVMGMDVI